MTIKEVARRMYAGKECHDFEFDSLWALRNSYGGRTVMAQWRNRAVLKWILTLAWFR